MASVAKRQPGQFVLETLLLRGIVRAGEAVGEIEEPVPLRVLRLETGLDEVDDDSVRTGMAGLREPPDALGDASRQGDALSHDLLGGWHSPKIHHDEPS